MDFIQIINPDPQKLQASQHQFLDDTKHLDRYDFNFTCQGMVLMY